MFLSLLCVWHHVRKWKLGGVLAFRAFALTSPGDAVFPGWATRGRSTSGLIRPCVRARKTQTHTYTHTRVYGRHTGTLLSAPESSWLLQDVQCGTRTDPNVRPGPRWTHCICEDLCVSLWFFFFFFNIFFYLFIFWLNSKCGFVNLHWFHVPAL